MKLKIKIWKVKTYIVTKEIFQYSLVTYLILLLAETVKAGVVSYFFNLNILLAVVLLSGMIMILTYDKKIPIPTPAHKKVRSQDIIYCILIALGGGFFVYAGTFDLGIIAIVVGCLAALLIFLLSLLLLTGEE